MKMVVQLGKHLPNVVGKNVNVKGINVGKVIEYDCETGLATYEIDTQLCHEIGWDTRYTELIVITDIMERKRVLSQVKINTDMFLTSFEKAAKLLLDQKDKLEREGWTNLHLEMEYSYESAELIVMGMRLENDDEYNERIADEQKKLLAAQKKEERERKKYEKLKLKFES